MKSNAYATSTAAASPSAAQRPLSSSQRMFAPAVRNVTVRRASENDGWGFLTKRDKFPLVVGKAEPETSILVDDEITLINGRRPQTYDQAFTWLRTAGTTVELQLFHNHQVPLSSAGSSSSPAAVHTPMPSQAAKATAPVTPAVQTSIPPSAFNVDKLLRHMPRVAQSAIYDRQNCPFSAADGFTDALHDKLQEFITSRALGSSGAASVDAIAAVQGRGHVRSVEELVHHVGLKNTVKKDSVVLALSSFSPRDQTEAKRQQNKLYAALGDIKRARDERVKDEAEMVQQRRKQAMENFAAVQKIYEEAQSGAGSTSFGPGPMHAFVSPAPAPAFSQQQQRVMSIISNYFGQHGFGQHGDGMGGGGGGVVGQQHRGHNNAANSGGGGNRHSGGGGGGGNSSNRSHHNSGGHSKKKPRRDHDHGK